MKHPSGFGSLSASPQEAKAAEESDRWQWFDPLPRAGSSSLSAFDEAPSQASKAADRTLTLGEVLLMRCVG